MLRANVIFKEYFGRVNDLDLLKILKERDLPALKSREEMIKILLDEEYGYLPSTEYKVSVSEPKVIERRYHVGTAVHSVVNMTDCYSTRITLFSEKFFCTFFEVF